MKLRHLPLGARFILKRDRKKYVLNGAQIRKEFLFVKEEGKKELKELNCQCEVTPLIKCDGKFRQSSERLHAVVAIKASK